jgi:tetratricopeptide (TPR) repeat protein
VYLLGMNDDAMDFLTQHQATWDRLMHLLQPEGMSPSLLILGTEGEAHRDLLLEALVPETSHYQHIILDLGQEQVHSLADVLQSRFADLMGGPLDHAVQHFVHVIHLEHTLLHEILAGEGQMIAQLEAERETLRTGFPFQLLLWVDPYLWRRLQHEATQLGELVAGQFAFFDDRLEPEHPAPSDQVYLRLMELSSQQRKVDTADPTLSYQIGHLLEERSLLAPAMTHYQAALAQGADVPLQVQIHEGLAHLYARESEPGAAMEAYQAALDLTDEDDLPAMARLHEQQGDLYLQLQAIKEADASYGQALSAFEALDDDIGQARMHRRLAHGKERSGQLDQAVQHYLHAVELWRTSDAADPHAMAEAYQQVGAIRQNQRLYQDALAAFEEALSQAQATDDEFLIAALEDSVEAMQEEVERRGAKGTNDGKKRKGLFGRLRR